MTSRILLRVALWLGVAGTADANRRYFGLPTTWVLHLTLNSFLLFLPELYRGTATVLQLDARARKKLDLPSTIHAALRDAVLDNPNYALYVAPVALAYIVSHPRFNIYKGDLAKIRFLGFGLDALPHAATAFTFSNLAMDGLAALAGHTPPGAAWGGLARLADKHSGLLAGALLAAASVAYESGEYAIHREELRETGGDENKINMEWSALDTEYDLLSNTLGWLAAIMLRRRASGAAHSRPRRAGPRGIPGAPTTN